MNVLVTGTSGVGKSSVAAELARRGRSAWDVDEHAAWLDDDGNPLAWEECRPEDPAWLAANRWQWETGWIEAVLASERDEYVCGVTSDLADYVTRFDAIYLLVLDEAVQGERLDARTNNDFARGEDVRAQMRGWQETFHARMLKRRAIAIDAAQPLEVVADEILAGRG